MSDSDASDSLPIPEYCERCDDEPVLLSFVSLHLCGDCVHDVVVAVVEYMADKYDTAEEVRLFGLPNEVILEG